MLLQRGNLVCVIGRLSLALLLTLAMANAGAATLEQVFGSGWQCPLMANSLYKPGSVFEVNSSGAKRFVADLTGLPGYSETIAKASVGRFTSERNVSTGVYVSLLGRLLKGISGSLAASLGSHSTSVIEFEIDKYVVTPPSVLQLARRQLESVQPNPTSSYFLVREAVAVRSMVHQVGDNVSGKLGVKADVRKMVEVNVDVVQGGQSANYLLKATFLEPMWACYSVDQLLPQRNITGATTWDGTRAPAPSTDADDLAQPYLDQP
jgi:hypothetical protein